MDWMRTGLCDQFRMINPDDLEIMHLTDEVEEAMKIVREVWREAEDQG